MNSDGEMQLEKGRILWTKGNIMPSWDSNSGPQS